MHDSTEQPLQERELLVVEIGNTTTALVLFRGSELLEVHKVSTASLSGEEPLLGHLVPLLERYPLLCDAVLCSVVPSLDPLVTELLRRYLTGQVLTVTSSIRLPFTLHYASPASFGADRIALCALSEMLYPDEAVIALDIGTAITVDVLGSDRNYRGGLIMPGLDLMANSLHQHTARLPQVKLSSPLELIGRSTGECINNGIIWNAVSGLDGLVAKITTWLQRECHEERVRVIATGGSAPLMVPLLDSSPVHEELAVPKGSRYLFELNL